jgi:hypothetical protein
MMPAVNVPAPQTSAPAPSRKAFTKDRTTPAANSQSGARHGRCTCALSMRWIQPALRFRKLNTM